MYVIEGYKYSGKNRYIDTPYVLFSHVVVVIFVSYPFYAIPSVARP